MATIKVDYNGTNLALSDNGHTNAKGNDPIHWHPGKDVVKITDIRKKPDSPSSTSDFWAEAPHENGVNFKGKIADIKVGDWKYDITATVKTPDGHKDITEDPRIQVEADVESGA